MSRALDDIAPAFRAACERGPHAPNLQQHYVELRVPKGGNNHDSSI